MVLPQITKFSQVALDLLFPKWCVGCGKEGYFICPSCRQSLLRIVPPVCPQCGKPQPSGMLCPDCVGQPVAIDGIRSPFQFDGVMRQAIHQLKYRNLRALAKPLAKLLSDYLAINPIPAEWLVPVPLHQKRLRERGYNQSQLLARELSQLTGLPVMDNCLIRQRYSFPQTQTQSVTERRSNVAGAFISSDSQLKDRAVLVIDDVSTTGATLNACAIALKAAGAISVWGLSLATEIKQN
ncbi:MAG: ComF family protein [Dehalococcoidales bacterium]|nr:ComF family protein [Dehalococcoidales bacterium]